MIFPSFYQIAQSIEVTQCWLSAESAQPMHTTTAPFMSCLAGTSFSVPVFIVTGVPFGFTRMVFKSPFYVSAAFYIQSKPFSATQPPELPKLEENLLLFVLPLLSMVHHSSQRLLSKPASCPIRLSCLVELNHRWFASEPASFSSRITRNPLACSS